MWAPAAPVGLTGEQRRVLEGWVRAPSTPQGLVLKARIILMASEGIANHAIAKTLGTSRPTVQLWRQRFGKGGLKALTKIEKGRGPKPVIPPEKVTAIVEATLHSRPPGATHWSCRTMAKAMGVSPDTALTEGRQVGRESAAPGWAASETSPVRLPDRHWQLTMEGGSRPAHLGPHTAGEAAPTF